jgi:hypothetical protein
MVPLKDVFLKIHLYAGLDRFKSILFFKTIFFNFIIFLFYLLEVEIYFFFTIISI